jgi:hypothetical protein
MIKLFWNTHSQNKPTSNDSTDKEARDYKWGLYHKDNSDKWIYEVLDKIQFKIIQDEKDIEKDDILIIVDSSIEKKGDFYAKLSLVCYKIFLIHLGDENDLYDLTSIYDNFDFVWRTFCLNKYFNSKKVSCLPIGYKSGVSFIKNKGERKYKWVFIGTPHKSSRHDLLFQLSDMKLSFIHRTTKFDEKIITVDEMNKVLSLTEFVPCPNGFVHPETYRIYEALECGCIPIVENAYKYYDRLFPGNPFIKINKWIEARSIIQEWKSEQISQKREECKIWWTQYKDSLKKFISDKINL